MGTEEISQELLDRGLQSPSDVGNSSPGLDKELLALIQATAEVELKNADSPGE